LISTRFGETSQLHWVKAPGGARHQLTFFEEPIAEVAMVPGADRPRLILGRDIGGSENYQLYLFDLDRAEAKLLTDGESRNGSVAVSHRGDKVAFHTTRRNGRDLHLLKLDGTSESKPLLEEGGVWFPIAWSPDDTRLLVARYVSRNETYPYILDISSSNLTPIQKSDAKVSYGDLAWAADGKGVYLTSDEGSEFQQLIFLDLKSGSREVLTGHIPWDIHDLTVAPDGKWLAFAVNEGGAETFHLWEAATRKEVAITPLPVGQISSPEFSDDSRQLALVLNTPQTAGDVFVIDLQSAKRDHTRWTQSEVGGLDTSRFSSAELIHFDTFDRVDGKPRQIPAFYYKPSQGSGPWPVVIDIHGGPEGQHRPSFDPGIQYLVSELGIAVVAPNVRGSSGYGKSYLQLDNGRKREDSVKDIGKLLDWIATHEELDADRVAVSGGSYGGYMVLASLVHFGDRLRGGVDVVGISNFVTFLENTEEYRQDLRRAEYGDERDPEMRAFLEKISPANSASEITKPLFIVQGANDPRVPASEAEQILAAVRANGGEPWYLLAKDEGHGFRKKSNRDYYANASSLFFEYLLKGDPLVRKSAPTAP